jgi:ABC-type Mn2+/Zn2+ transport system ATPase subunit
LTLVTAEDVAVGYGGRPVLEGLTFDLEPGQRLGVLGPNGGGKSTLVRALLGELTPLAGRLEVAVRCSVVPQTERSRLDYPVTALDVALMGSLSRLPWWRRPGRRERRSALDALAAVHLAELAARPFGELSGGQRQRVLVARALVQDAGLVLLDEPFTGVDVASAEVLAALIDSLAAEGRGVLVATHDVDQARGFDRVLCLNGRQVAFGRPEVLTRSVLEETYGGAIVAVPEGADGQPARGILPAHHHEHGHGHE